MALTPEMKAAIEEDAGVKGAFKSGDKAAAATLIEMATLAIPGVGVFRLPRIAGKLTPKAKAFLDSMKKVFPKSKVNNNPTNAQLNKAQPISAAPKPKAKPKAAAKKAAPKAAAKKAAPTPTPPKPKPKPKPTPTPPKPKPKPKAAAKKAAPKAAAKKKAPPPQSKTAPKPTKKKAPPPRSKTAQRKKDRAKRAVIAGVTLGGAAALVEKARRGGQADAGSKKRKPTGTYERSAGIPMGGKPPKGTKENRPKDSAVSPKPNPKSKPQKKSKPKRMPDKQAKPERKSSLPPGVLRKFQGTLRKGEVLRNINGVSYVIRREDSAFAGRKKR